MMYEIIKLERQVLCDYGVYRVAEDDAKDAGLVAALITMVAYIIGLVCIGPIWVPSNLLLRLIGGFMLMGSCIVIPGLVGCIVSAICRKIFKCDKLYSNYRRRNSDLKRLISDLRKEEEDT